MGSLLSNQLTHAAPSAGLYLPTSDLDLVILDSGCSDIVSGLRALAQYLVRKSLATDIQVRCCLRSLLAMACHQIASQSMGC